MGYFLHFLRACKAELRIRVDPELTLKNNRIQPDKITFLHLLFMSFDLNTVCPGSLDPGYIVSYYI